MDIFSDVFRDKSERSTFPSKAVLLAGWIITLDDDDMWRKAVPLEGGRQAFLVVDCGVGECPLIALPQTR